MSKENGETASGDDSEKLDQSLFLRDKLESCLVMWAFEDGRMERKLSLSQQ